MTPIPRDAAFDSSLAFLAEPYEFISKRCQRYGAHIFEARLLLRRTICMSGAQAAELFCDPEKFTRQAAAPRRVVKTLFGEGGVQSLDGGAHQHRKAMFKSLMTPERIAALASLTETLWRERAQDWQGAGAYNRIASPGCTLRVVAARISSATKLPSISQR